MIEWKEVKKRNYKSFGNKISVYRFRTVEELLVSSNGMLTVWDEDFEDVFNGDYFENRLLDSLKSRSDTIISAFYAV